MLDNGTLSVFSIEKFEFILTQQVLDGAIINIEAIFMKDEQNQSQILLIQGKEGEIVILSHNLDSNSTEILLRWKDPEIVGFTKVSINNRIWTSQTKEQDSCFNERNQIFRGLDDLRFYYPDNNDQNILAFNLIEKDFKKQDLMIPPPKAGAKEISVCCLKHVAFEDQQGNIQEYVLTAEENSRLGILSINKEKFNKSKFKELYQHKTQSYAHFILPYQIVKDNDKILLKVLVGLNVEDTIIMSIDLQNQQILTSKLFQFSSGLKPGITNGLMFRQGKYILISTSDFRVKIYRTKDFKQIVSLNMHDNYVNNILLISPEESQKEYLISCSEDKDFCILDFSSLKK